MTRLVVISNRVASPAETKVATGGLALSVLTALRDSGGLWFGWSGKVSDTTPNQAELFESDGLSFATVDLSQQDYEEYYNGFANQTLWPLFHTRLDKMSFNRRSWSGYLRVNTQFARILQRMLKPDDRIWVHDFHLIPFALSLRKAGFEGPIGFFLHTPFPPCEVLRALPFHADIVQALCQYDLVGFQTERDLAAFHDYILNQAEGAVGGDGSLIAFGRKFHACALPISIDTKTFGEMAEVASRSAVLKQLKNSLTGRAMIIGIDRLDYTKGLVERFEAFNRLLSNYPEHRKNTTLMQIAPLSRTDVPEYSEIRRELEEASGHINGRFAEFNWVPIRYLNRSMQRRTLAGFLRYATVGLVTPLCDGMNLVAKEYIAAQDPKNPGALVLSEFAGAAEELQDALLVNPYDVEGVAQALQKALTMPLPERKERWQAMYQKISDNDISVWRNRFLAALDEATS